MQHLNVKSEFSMPVDPRRLNLTIASPFSFNLAVICHQHTAEDGIAAEQNFAAGSDNIEQNRAIRQERPTAFLRTLPKNRALAGRVHPAILTL